ncbi:MAG: hypothetical protein O9264_15190 [Leptospira sp.]|nr:hypothetical protein [Leptospira sp.]
MSSIPKKRFFTIPARIVRNLLIACLILSPIFLSCKKEEKEDRNGLFLLFLLNRNTSTDSTGFFINIPDGVAK